MDLAAEVLPTAGWVEAGGGYVATAAHHVRVDSPACLLPTPPVLSEERAMPDEKPPEAKVTDRLFATYVSSDRKVLDIDGFKAALVKALGDAYEQGLQDGLVTRTTGPDA